MLRGREREQNERFILFRSHWQYEASFCTPAQGHEKGGVEGEVGYFRRNHLVPVPVAANLAELNEQILASCRADEARLIGERTLNVGAGMAIERAHLMPLQSEGFEIAEQSFAVVDGKGCVSARTNCYSAPLRVGTRVRVKVLPAYVEVWHEGRCVARHERCYQNRQQVLDLEHYLDVLAQKPGAFAGSKPLAQWRAEGRWTSAHDELWQKLQARHGAQAGTRLMIGVLQMGRSAGYERLLAAIQSALQMGVSDVAAVHYLLAQLARGEEGEAPPVAPLALSEVKRAEHYSRPVPTLTTYDQLLADASSATSEVAR